MSKHEKLVADCLTGQDPPNGVFIWDPSLNPRYICNFGSILTRLPNFQVGHRTYENMKTIRPNMVLLGQLFLNKSLTWVEFQEAVVEGHRSRQGLLRLRRSQQSIYTYPAPDCMCSAWGCSCVYRVDLYEFILQIVCVACGLYYLENKWFPSSFISYICKMWGRDQLYK